MEHTPGHWTVVERGNLGWDITPEAGIRGQFEYKSDALKAAAAQEMLEALELVLQEANDPYPLSKHVQRKVHAAIAKAKGE